MALLIENAKIYLGQNRFAQALLINDNGRIEAVGSLDEVNAQASENTPRYNAQGRTIIPGFNDSHMHLYSKAELLADIELLGARSVDEVKARVRHYLETQKPAPGTVLHGMGWNQDYFEHDGYRLLTKEDLDEVSPNHPLILERACGHILVANSEALRLAGITPESTPVEGGAIDLDENGELTGIVRENSCVTVLAIRPAATFETQVKNLRLAIDYANRNGITSVQTMDMRPRQWLTMYKVYQEALGENPTLRVTHQVNFMEPKGFQAFLDEGFHTGLGDEFNRIGPLKMFVDGSLGARTADMRQPYADDPTTSGISTLSVEAMNTMVELADSHGCQVIMHAIGDGAIERVLNAYERVNPTHDNPNRHGVVHVQITDRPLLERFKTQNVLAFTQPIFLHYDIQICEARVGKALASTSYAFGTLHRLGVHQSFGTDCPIEDLNPIDCLYCAVNRRQLTGLPEGGFYPNECLSVPDAIDAYTYEGAYASFEEDFKGRLLPGYVADLVVLSEDIFTMDPLKLRETKVLATMVNGRFVYEA